MSLSEPTPWQYLAVAIAFRSQLEAKHPGRSEKWYRWRCEQWMWEAKIRDNVTYEKIDRLGTRKDFRRARRLFVPAIPDKLGHFLLREDAIVAGKDPSAIRCPTRLPQNRAERRLVKKQARFLRKHRPSVMDRLLAAQASQRHAKAQEDMARHSVSHDDRSQFGVSTDIDSRTDSNPAQTAKGDRRPLPDALLAEKL